MLRIQTPQPAPGVYWPIDSNGKVNYGYTINGPGCGGGSSLIAVLLLAGLGALGYAVGAAVAR